MKLYGEWLTGYTERNSLVEYETGLWSVTVGPLEPEACGYLFQVDGLMVLDPSNPIVRRDGQRNASLVIDPGKESELFSVKDVPHVTLSMVWYHSATLGKNWRIYHSMFAPMLF